MMTIQDEAIRLVNKVRKNERYETYRLFKRQVAIDMITFAIMSIAATLVILSTSIIEIGNIMITLWAIEGLRLIHSAYQMVDHSVYRVMRSHFSAEDEK